MAHILYVDKDGISSQSKKREEVKPHVSGNKSIDDKGNITSKQTRFQEGEKWLKDVLFTDSNDSKGFDELTQQYQ